MAILINQTAFERRLLFFELLENCEYLLLSNKHIGLTVNINILLSNQLVSTPVSNKICTI